MTAHPRPPWHRRLRPGHWLAVDALAAGLLFVGLVRSVHWHPAGRGVPVAVTALLVVLAVAPVAVRRRWPVTTLGVAVLAGASLSVARALPVPSVVHDGPALILYCVAERLGWRRSGPVLAATVVAAFAAASTDGAFAFPILVGGWAAGVFVHQRRSYASWLRVQEAARAVTDERLRIARELHDVVSHSMSAIAVRAGVANHVADEEPGEARQALGDIEAISRTAMRELRQMLGLLRAEAGETPGVVLTPVPGLDQLDRLVADVSGSGVQVEVHIAGEARPVPPGVGLAAYRIIQEALTNVVKHAGAARSTVTVGYRPLEVSVEVVDDGQPGAAGHPPGHGLIGMRERVGLHGGRFSAGPLPGRGFRVRATLPLREGEQ